MRTKVKMPKVGETAEIVVVLECFVQNGTVVSEGDPLMQVETDKVDVEIPSPIPGSVVEVLVASGDEVAIGDPICIIESP